MIKVFLIVNELKITCGVSACVYNFTKEILNNNNYKIYIICGGGDGIQRVKDLNIDVIIDDSFKHESRSVKGFIKAHMVLYKLVKKYNPDIIHSHHHYAGNIAKNISLITGKKIVFTNHGLLPEKGMLNHFPAPNIVSINEHISAYLISSRNKFKQVRLIRCGIQDFGNFIKPLNDKIIFLAASRFVYEKGLDIYIEAVSRLSQDYRIKAEFYLAGKGAGETKLKKLNEKLNAGVIFPGEVNDMKSRLINSDVFVFPSRSKSEGFPLVMVEAAYAKNIVITSRFYGSDTILDYSADVVTFKNENPEDLKSKMEAVIDNSELYKSYAETFHVKAKKLFSVSENTRQMTEFYSDILSS